ncbi:uncharacterized protein N7473_011291 [Penicillium subrubescens]|uniref:uncharacterized protein n=1 Tax=Penicillium subrubescens TaxID=1316194 RepID=UPI00254573CE|nr:uncharacterized protein N7473_011291 [Penicillium subrubescens]KAJ5880238.1 hypothetical protein N7473_011291 [Penicillium subrubescens]
MDAQLSGYVNGDLSFQAHGDYDSSDNAFHYRFGAYLFYNIGYKAKAKILSVIDWATGDRMAYNLDKMLQLYEKKGTIPMSHSNAEKRDSSIHSDRIPQIDADLLDNTTHSVLNPAADIFRRTDISRSGVNCAFLSTYQVVNEIKDADGVSERLTEDVPGLCDDIVKLNPLQSRFTFSQGENTQGHDTNGTCRQATRDLNAAVRRSILQLQCDEFPWKSSEQGMMGSLTSNWKQLNSALREDSDVPNLWVPWQDKTKWVTAGDYGKNGDYKQKLVLYESAMPPPDGADQGDNDKFSWAYKRDYDVSWLQPQSSLTAGDWWGAGSPKFDKPNYQGPLDMDSILCAINHFNQDKAFKLPGAHLKPDGTPSNKPQKEYNAYCMRTDAGGMQPASWNMRFNMGKCLVKFQNPASSSPGSSKRDMGKWQGWEVESVEWVEDVDDEEWL